MARPAEIYLPPAALVAYPPPLPLVIMMMGQPGGPNPAPTAAALDQMAHRNHGLSPIVLVVDQLSDPTIDPLCLNTSRGNVEAYLTQDVLPWALQHINMLQTRDAITIAGYSTGGECSSYLGAKYPEKFGNILAISPEEFAGWHNAGEVLDQVFHGDKAAYDVIKTPNIMAKNAPYSDTFIVITAGAKDTKYGPGAKRLAEAAEHAGMKTTFRSVPGAQHGRPALDDGLKIGYEALYPRLGLS